MRVEHMQLMTRFIQGSSGSWNVHLFCIVQWIPGAFAP
jgi:hypothetical protein